MAGSLFHWFISKPIKKDLKKWVGFLFGSCWHNSKSRLASKAKKPWITLSTSRSPGASEIIDFFVTTSAPKEYRICWWSAVPKSVIASPTIASSCGVSSSMREDDTNVAEGGRCFGWGAPPAVVSERLWRLSFCLAFILATAAAPRLQTLSRARAQWWLCEIGGLFLWIEGTIVCCCCCFFGDFFVGTIGTTDGCCFFFGDIVGRSKRSWSYCSFRWLRLKLDSIELATTDSFVKRIVAFPFAQESEAWWGLWKTNKCLGRSNDNQSRMGEWDSGSERRDRSSSLHFSDGVLFPTHLPKLARKAAIQYSEQQIEQRQCVGYVLFVVCRWRYEAKIKQWWFKWKNEQCCCCCSCCVVMIMFSIKKRSFSREPAGSLRSLLYCTCGFHLYSSVGNIVNCLNYSITK